MTSLRRRVLGLVLAGAGLGLSVLAGEIGNSALRLIGTALGSACLLFGAYVQMTAMGRGDPGSPWSRRGRRLQWIGGLVLVCGVLLGVAMVSRRIDEMSMALFIGMLVSGGLGVGLYFVGLGLQAVGAPEPVIDYAKEHPYPSHEDRLAGD